MRSHAGLLHQSAADGGGDDQLSRYSALISTHRLIAAPSYEERVLGDPLLLFLHLPVIVSGIRHGAKVMFVHIRPDVASQIGAGFLTEAKMNASVDACVA